VTEHQKRAGMRWAAVSLVLALGASLVLLFAPLGTSVEATASSPASPGVPVGAPQPETRVTHPSLIEIQGWSVAVPLAIPVALAGMGVVAARFRWRPAIVALAVVVGAFVVLGALSVGVFYLPAEVAMIVAAVKAGS
jgi:hypothetical protein